MSYIHENPDWPNLRWDDAKLLPLLADVRHRQGRLLGRMEGLGFRLRAEASLTTLTSDVIKSSAIEGALLDAEQVRSSIARRLGLDFGGNVKASRDVEGVVEMMLDATQKYAEPLTAERLFGWHASLFPTGRSGMRRITVGAWRPADIGAMQVVSGPMGRERVHFEAPAADRLEHEVSVFLDWFEAANGIDPVLKAGIAHFWFVTIHPFEDGNGRISRAIADMALARAEGIEGTVLQHVHADRSREKAVLFETGAKPKGRSGYYFVAGMVPGLSGTCRCGGGRWPGERSAKSKNLGTNQQPVAGK